MLIGAARRVAGGWVAFLVAIVAIAAPAIAFAQQDPEPDRVREGAVLDDTDDTPAAPSVATPEEPTKITKVAALREPSRRWETRVLARIRVGAGGVSGDTINPGRGALTILEGQVKPRLKRGRLSIEAPLDFSYRQTYGSTSLSETRGAGTLGVKYVPMRHLRVAVDVGLSGTRKPGWPDPFQPLDDGSIAGTDRYSHWDRRAGVEAEVRWLHHRVRVAYDYVLSVYTHDPMFDAIYDPIHLSPWDRDTHTLDVVWQHHGDRYKVQAGTELARRKYFYVFSGDANTGITHAGPGGELPNPLLELRSAKPRVEGEYDLSNALVARAGYELELQKDMYKGYLSFVGHHPEAAVIWTLPKSVQLTAKGEVYLRRYGVNSYNYDEFTMDESHAALAYGDRREERLWMGSLDVRWPFANHWSAIANGRAAIRRTNYDYTINWDYVNWLGWVGAEYRYF